MSTPSSTPVRTKNFVLLGLVALSGPLVASRNLWDSHCLALPSADKSTGVQAFEQSVVGNEPGDSAKAVTRMIELTTGTGMAAGKTVPLRVPLGTDGWTRIRDKCEATLKICEEWEDVAKSTDVQQ